MDSNEKSEDEVNEKQMQGDSLISLDLNPLNSIELTEMPHNEHILSLELKKISEKYNETNRVNEILKEKMEDLKVEISDLNHKINKMRAEIEEKDKLLLDYQTANNFFHPDQQEFLAKGHLKGKGRKWSNNSVEDALKIRFACGPSGYDLLKSLKWPLPSLPPLTRRIKLIKFDYGILQEVFDMMAIKTKTLDEYEKFCGIVLDEMSIKEGFDYDASTDQFLGQVNLPSHFGMATKGLVFMLVEITTRWKQPVTYYLTADSTDGSVYGNILMQLILQAEKIGLRVCFCTSDMGPSNLAM